MNAMESAKALQLEMWRRVAGRNLLAFMQYCWWMPSDVKPLRIGRHTRALCARLTQAIEDFKRGKSTYLITNMPFRHGKSDTVSRALPAYFLGNCAAYDPDVIMSGYGTSLVKGFSRKVQSIMKGDAYAAVFPGVEVDPVRNAAEEWSCKGRQGVVTAQGLGGSITGKGGNLIIVDDYCKNREEAESHTYREKVWLSFKDDLMTRTNAPAAIVIVCATRWHTDDIVGRIYEEMKKDPEYPQFESLVFPARKDGPDGWDTLFPELYDAGWYARQRAQLGSYSSAALLDCNPVGTGTTDFRDEWFMTYHGSLDARKMNIHLFIDSANAKKKDSDYTVMLVVGRAADGNYYVLDGVRDRLDLAQRTQELFRLQRNWHPIKATWWEQQGAMSDVSHVRIEQTRELYHFPITELHHNVPKVDRIRRLVPEFEGARIWWPTRMLKRRVDGSWYDLVADFRDEYDNFPMVKHDDIIDCLADIKDPVVEQSFNAPKPIGASAGGDGGAKARWERRIGFR